MSLKTVGLQLASGFFFGVGLIISSWVMQFLFNVKF